MADQEIKYKVTENQELMVVLYEHTSMGSTNPRQEVAIIRADAKVEQLKQIKAAFDGAFGGGRTGSNIQIKPVYTAAVVVPIEKPTTLETHKPQRDKIQTDKDLAVYVGIQQAKIRDFNQRIEIARAEFSASHRVTQRIAQSNPAPSTVDKP